MEIGRGLADKNGNGVFKLLALLLEENSLSAGGIQQSFFLRNVQAGCDSTSVPGIDEL